MQRISSSLAESGYRCYGAASPMATGVAGKRGLPTTTHVRGENLASRWAVYAEVGESVYLGCDRATEHRPRTCQTHASHHNTRPKTILSFSLFLFIRLSLIKTQFVCSHSAATCSQRSSPQEPQNRSFYKLHVCELRNFTTTVIRWRETGGEPPPFILNLRSLYPPCA